MKAAIFDMDGVLFDTERLGAIFWKKAAEDLNFEINDEVLSNITGRNPESGSEYFLKKYEGKVDYKIAGKLKNEYLLSYITKNGLPIKNGVLSILEYLRSNNYKIALATSSLEDTVNIYFGYAGIEKYFDLKICGNMISKGKPDPEIYLKSMELLNEKPGDVFIFEDSPAGIIAGYRAGGNVIAIPDTVPLTKEILNYPICCCSSLEIAIKFIKNYI
ncbi:MAG: HAD family phosphatase [Fusobacteriaceae bacterium]|nr:HAD family phosphatase [Fusobacteriaceae bacterium]